jgi:PII-like signaling protein
MNLAGNGKKLKVIVDYKDILYERPLYEALLMAAKKYRIAGTTIYKGVMSYGADSLINNVKVFHTSGHTPVVIEMIDKEERINDFADIVSRLLKKADAGGLVYIEDVNIILYNHSQITF